MLVLVSTRNSRSLLSLQMMNSQKWIHPNGRKQMFIIRKQAKDEKRNSLKTICLALICLKQDRRKKRRNRSPPLLVGLCLRHTNAALCNNQFSWHRWKYTSNRMLRNGEITFVNTQIKTETFTNNDSSFTISLLFFFVLFKF